MNIFCKKILPLFLCFSFFLLFVACGSTNSTSDSNSKSIANSSNVTTSQTDDTKTITTTMGDVEVPASPQRVVVQYLMGDVIALGITPVGTTQVLEGATFEPSLKGSQNLGNWEFDLESLMALEPDLIIAASDKQYQDFSKIAPTVIVPYGSMTTQERITFLGEVLSKQEEATKIITDYTDKIASVKNQLQQAGLENSTATILQASESGISVSGNKHAVGIIAYEELGLAIPAYVKEEIVDKDQYWAQPSMEVLEKYCGDYLIHLGPVPEEIAQNNIWNLIPGVKNNHIIECDTFLTYYTDILSSTELLDFITTEMITLSNNSSK